MSVQVSDRTEPQPGDKRGVPLVKLVGIVIPLRPSPEDEMTGLDISQHGEEAYLHVESSDGMIS